MNELHHRVLYLSLYVIHWRARSHNSPWKIMHFVSITCFSIKKSTSSLGLHFTIISHHITAKERKEPFLIIHRKMVDGCPCTSKSNQTKPKKTKKSLKSLKARFCEMMISYRFTCFQGFTTVQFSPTADWYDSYNSRT